MSFKTTSKLYYVLAMPVVFFTLLYTGIVRRPFYALPILAVNIVARYSVVALVGFIAILYYKVLPLPVTHFLGRIETLFSHAPNVRSMVAVITGAENPLPEHFGELAIRPVDFWHFELIFPIPMWEYLVLFGLFIGACITSIIFDLFLRKQ